MPSPGRRQALYSFGWRFWLASFILLILDWRAGKPPRDPSFTRPDADVEEGEEEEWEEGDHSYQPVANTIPTYPPDSSTNRTSAYSTAPTTTTAPTTSTNYPASRPSMDAYGAFSDPAPSGFGGVSTTYAPPPSDPATPRVSRTMQYADPYAAVRALLATSTTSPPSYEPYTGYR
ncbi:hypothetical protein M405DRAFT_939214 [Rhizopogon salebrosus TDB-379]|nr:hypothetical protein M405DRAFT_939214 [Rhizopogon salebrosus TDB-379]